MLVWFVSKKRFALGAGGDSVRCEASSITRRNSIWTALILSLKIFHSDPMKGTVIRFWYIRSTFSDAAKTIEMARLYCRRPIDTSKAGWRSPEVDKDCIWIPASIIEHTMRRGTEHEVTLPDWFIAKNGL